MICKGFPVESYHAKNGSHYIIWSFNDTYYAYSADPKDTKTYAVGSESLEEARAELDSL